MHRIVIPQSTIDRVLKRYGKLHSFEDLNPYATALIVIDLQNCFLVEETASAYVPHAVDIIPNVNRLAHTVRETGGKVFWIRNTADEHTLATWSNWFGRMTVTPDQLD